MRYLSRVFVFLFCFVFFLNFHSTVLAQNVISKYFKAEVVNIKNEGVREAGEIKYPFQEVELKILDGEEKDKTINLEHGSSFQLTQEQKVKKGDQIVLIKHEGGGGEAIYSIIDKYRINQLVFFLLGFFGLVILITGKKGVGAILGLFISFFVILSFIVPRILAGNDPLLISIIGSFIILISTIYLAHGISKQTTIALVSTLITLLITGILAVLVVKFSFLTGLGSEDAYNLQLGPTKLINLKGLLLGGILIGTLGVLDDITTAQSATVFELFKLNPKQRIGELVKRGMNVGREHIASLVNTLVLAYAGASLSLFILFVFNPQGTPIWVILNSEVVAEELIRTLLGSFALVLAVPLTTAMAAWWVVRIKNEE